MDDTIARLEKLAEDTNLRITAQERELASLKQDVAIIRSNYVTKEDLYRAIEAQTGRLVTFVCGFGTVLVTATWFIFAHTR
jgi:hypothetical protein